MKKISVRKQPPKTILGKIWFFIWKDDSIWSWLVSLVLAFILVKFILFPLLSLIFASSMPLVVVESTSMYHEGGFLKQVTGFGNKAEFDSWWDNSKIWYESHNITYDQANKWSFKSGLDKGDIIVIMGTKNLHIGDIIVFDGGALHPIIHRIVNIRDSTEGKVYDTIKLNNSPVYETKGDNYITNPNQLSIEKGIRQSDIIGKAVFRVPRLGWIKLIIVQFFQSF